MPTRTVLLPIGMTAVEGDFSRGDVIAIRDVLGNELARGLANYASVEARLILGRLRQQQSAYDLTLHQADQRVGLAPPGDHRGRARPGGALGRKNLGDHAAASQAAARATGHGFELWVTGHRLVNELRGRILARVRAEQAALIRQDHQHVGFDQVRHQRAQGRCRRT